jgi:hypothetical protein
MIPSAYICTCNWFPPPLSGVRNEKGIRCKSGTIPVAVKRLLSFLKGRNKGNFNHTTVFYEKREGEVKAESEDLPVTNNNHSAFG